MLSLFACLSTEQLASEPPKYESNQFEVSLYLRPHGMMYIKYWKPILSICDPPRENQA